LLNDILDLSKIEAGKFTISPTPTDLKHLLAHVRRLWQARADEKGLALRLSVDAEMPSSFALDSVRVQQCVSNLVSNAIKFTEKGEVDLVVRSRQRPAGEHAIEIRVRDSGIGMSEETLAKLFRPFVQADETSSRQFGGTGLGLSIARRLAQLMGGDVAVTSEPGRGSEFVLTFVAQGVEEAPSAQSKTSSSADVVREAIRKSGLRILLVDDNAINRQVVSLFLRPFKLRIVEAANGAEALTALEHETFDLVLLDMHMPVMDGPTTIRRIRHDGRPWSNIRVVALTADAMSGDRERYLAMGMDGYLAKPIAERDLLAEILRVTSNAANIRLAG
jgi:CheY-like chemotaxis protein